MGDRRRFDLFGSLIAERFPERDHQIADVAAGKGHLRATLIERGYHHVTSWDKRPRFAKGRSGTRYGYFHWDKVPDYYSLVLGMHPDGGTDHLILYAIRHKIPFVICPCCVIPSAVTYWGCYAFQPWIAHLTRLATDASFHVEQASLKMAGRNLVLIGLPASHAMP